MHLQGLYINAFLLFKSHSLDIPDMVCIMSGIHKLSDAIPCKLLIQETARGTVTVYRRCMIEQQFDPVSPVLSQQDTRDLRA